MKTKSLKNVAILSITMLLISWCGSDPILEEDVNIESIENPASIYCEANGGVLELRTSEKGDQWECIFEDGSVCDEWDYFNWYCQPGDFIEEENSWSEEIEDIENSDYDENIEENLNDDENE